MSLLWILRKYCGSVVLYPGPVKRTISTSILFEPIPVAVTVIGLGGKAVVGVTRHDHAIQVDVVQVTGARVNLIQREM